MNERKAPEIRFKGFTDDWEQRKVSEITAFHKQGYYTTEEYGDDKKYYLLRGTDLTENRLALNDTPKINATERDYQAFKIQVGDFLIVRSGTVGTYGIVYDDIPSIFGSYLIDFRFDHSKATNEFFGYFYQSDLFKEQLRQIIQQSANTNINAENIKSTWIKLPSIEEQNKIGTFLGALDNLITLHQRKHKKLLSVKKSMLEKMFPQNGAKVPEIRFEGFTDDWEQRKLGDLMDVGSVKRVHQSDWRDSGVRFLRARDIVAESKNEEPDNYLYIDRRMYDEYSAVSGKVTDGDLLVTGVGTIGVPMLIKSDKPVYFKDGNIIWFKNKNAIDEKFFYYAFISKEIQDFIKDSAGTGTVGTYTIESGKKTPITLPSDKKEQREIGKFFSDLDNIITLHQRKQRILELRRKNDWI